MSGVSNEQILNAIMGLKQDMGGAQAVARNAHEYAHAVSKKADAIREEYREGDSALRDEIKTVEKSLSDHKKEDGAHGVAAEKRGWSAAQALFFSLVGAVGGIIAAIKFLAPLAKAAP